MCTIDQQSILGVRVVVSGTTIIDTALYEALTIALETADGTTVTFEQGNDSGLSDAVAVPSQFLIGDTVFTTATAGSALIGFVGKERYVRVTVATPVANSSIFALEGERDRDGEFQDVDKSN